MVTTEAKYAAILNTTAVTSAFENPTPNAAWACADTEPDVFFPSDNTALANAVAVCAGCGVREVCLSIAVARSESGVWGGVLLMEGLPQIAVKRRGRPPKTAVA